MNELQLLPVAYITAMVCVMTYSLHCHARLRDILLKHGKQPPLLGLKNNWPKCIQIATKLHDELTDASDLAELTVATAKAKRSSALVIGIFFAIGIVFVLTETLIQQTN